MLRLLCVAALLAVLPVSLNAQCEEGVTVCKEADVSAALVWQEIEYFIEVQNMSSCVMTLLEAHDTLLGPVELDLPEMLWPDEDGAAIYQYTIQPSDPDPLVNEITVIYEDEFGEPHEDTASVVIDIIHPSFTLELDCFSPPPEPDTDAEFQMLVTNSGDVALDFVFSGFPDSPPPVSLGPGETHTHIMLVPAIGDMACAQVLATATLPPEYGLTDTFDEFAENCCFAVPSRWSHDPSQGNLVCGAEGEQTEAATAPDGEGGVFLGWIDGRNGMYEVFAQHLDARGVPLWATDGIEVGGGAYYQTDIQLAPDGQGGVIMVWHDHFSGADDIYAQRIDASGTALWPTRGVQVCGAAGDQEFPRVLGDGMGGAFIVWEDSRNPTAVDIYAQRLNASGDALWAMDGVPVCTAGGDQSRSRLVPDGQFGMIISWEDERADVGDVYVQRMGSFGTPVWTADGVALCDLSMEQSSPRMVSDESGGAVVVWLDARSGYIDIYAQRVDPDGSERWAEDGILICNGAPGQLKHELIADGSHGAIICWQDHRAGNWDIYAQRVSGDGTALWTAMGVPVCTAGQSQQHPSVAGDGDGGAVVAWEDGRLQDDDVYAQRVDSEGNVLWDTDGVAVSTAAGSQLGHCMTTDGDGGAIIVWDDSRRTEEDIYAQRVERNGYLGYPSAEILSVRDVPGDQGGQVNLTWDASYLDPWPENAIDHYTLWRAISPGRGAVPAEDAVVLGSVSELARLPRSASEEPPDHDGPVFLPEERPRGTFYWELVATVEAYQLEAYSSAVPTLFDSTDISDEYHYFRTIAHTADPDAYWTSLPDSGRSVDNLAPGAAVALAANVDGADVDLTWSPSGYHDEDLGHYNVHRRETPGFVPDGTTLVGTATDTTFLDLDPGPTTWYYRVLAEDVHGNESDPSNEASATLGTGMDDAEIATVLTIRGNSPNPFNPTTRIEYDLPESGRIRLDVFSAAGDLVVTVEDGFREAGRRRVVWNGTDAAGNALPSGVYFARLEAGEEMAVHTMVLLK